MTVEYDINNWYWIVEGDETRVWSSAARDFLDAAATVYLAWVADGGAPTRIACWSELCDVINAPIVMKIEALERRQIRPMREIALSMSVAENMSRLAALDGEIASLRATLLTPEG
jgi:hypothetical protein